MPGKPAKRKLIREKRESNPLPRHCWTVKQIARKRAAVVAKLSTVIRKLRALERENWLDPEEIAPLKRTIALAEHTRGRVQHRLT